MAVAASVAFSVLKVTWWRSLLALLFLFSRGVLQGGAVGGLGIEATLGPLAPLAPTVTVMSGILSQAPLVEKGRAGHIAYRIRTP